MFESLYYDEFEKTENLTATLMMTSQRVQSRKRFHCDKIQGHQEANGEEETSEEKLKERAPQETEKPELDSAATDFDNSEVNTSARFSTIKDQDTDVCIYIVGDRIVLALTSHKTERHTYQCRA